MNHAVASSLFVPHGRDVEAGIGTQRDLGMRVPRSVQPDRSDAG
jgi:hypothetical protein